METKKFDAVLLCSGGMDSTVLAYHLKEQNFKVLPLFIDYGQHCREKEYQMLLKLLPTEFLKHLKVISLKDIYTESKSRLIVEANLWEDTVVADDLYLPYRNLLFLAAASAFAQSNGISQIYSAFIDSNHAKEIDCSLDFFNKLSGLLTEFGSVKVIFPFRFKTKAEVAKIGIRLGIPIAETYSCQANSKTHCGACPNCVDRIDALNSLLGEHTYG